MERLTEIRKLVEEEVKERRKILNLLKEKKPKLNRIESCLNAGWSIRDLVKEHNQFYNRNPITLEEMQLIVDWLKEK